MQKMTWYFFFHQGNFNRKRKILAYVQQVFRRNILFLLRFHTPVFSLGQRIVARNVIILFCRFGSFDSLYQF